jgi:protein required for attachment to host cells
VSDEDDYSYNKKVVSSVATTAITQEPLLVAERKKHEQDYSHKGENCHNKNTDEQSNEIENIVENEFATYLLNYTIDSLIIIALLEL